MSALYQVEINHQGQSYSLEVPENKTILEVALAAGVPLPSSCCAGVCTTCAAQILSGEVDQSEGLGISPDAQTQGYALLCVAYPRSDLSIVSEKEEVVYQLQFGQHQK